MGTPTIFFQISGRVLIGREQPLLGKVIVELYCLAPNSPLETRHRILSYDIGCFADCLNVFLEFVETPAEYILFF
ncbi:hypothetical protein E4413_05770 [Leptospira interrogans]|nr:hypothetical protein C4X99_16110 [Leptospira interrogans serovar Geyaweera]QCO37990.1 hypothetical protein E4412_12865 [Leptospira interrogans]QCO40475.1 hypothetical protein E4413_05770 [Leptospira interrogans]